MHGWAGKIIRVDLSAGSVRNQSLDPAMARAYIGGRGFGIRILLAELDPTCDPLGSDNILVMATGPLTGTRAPTGGRYMVITKSPLTGAITCSNVMNRGWTPSAWAVPSPVPWRCSKKG
jgi:aldehyde:ferredoxin oxidoreductase